jgi:hypothetical protein
MPGRLCFQEREAGDWRVKIRDWMLGIGAWTADSVQYPISAIQYRWRGGDADASRRWNWTGGYGSKDRQGRGLLRWLRCTRLGQLGPGPWIP